MDFKEKFIEKNIAELAKKYGIKKVLSTPRNFEDISSDDYKDIDMYTSSGRKMPPSEIRDLQRVYAKCEDCGIQFDVGYQYAKSMQPNHHWRCKKCMNKHRSEFMKTSSFSIGNIIKSKMNDPNERDKYLKGLAERSKAQWNNKSPEEKEEWKKKFFAGHKAHYQDLTQEEKNKIAEPAHIAYSNKSETERNEIRKKQSAAKKKFFAAHPGYLEQMSVWAKQRFDNMTDEEKKAWSDQTKRQWENMSDEELEKALNHIKNLSSKYWASVTPEQLAKRAKHSREAVANRSAEKRAEISKIHSDRWKKMNPKEKDRLLKLSAIHSNLPKNRLHKKFENLFDNSILASYFYFSSEYEVYSNDDVKRWDYGIFDQDGNLVAVVDLDGAFYHADGYDYDGAHSREEYDERRPLFIPDKVKWCIINEKNIQKCFKNLIKILSEDYDEFINNIFRQCRSMPFPYPEYSELKLINSYSKLVSMDCSKKYYKDISINTRLGDHLIQHFHHSIWHAHVKGKPSPYDAWYDDKLLKKVIENRIIYQNTLNRNKILQGFNISKVAPKVSVFSAGRAKLILNKYAKEYDTIFDPFSGFSGRMLGTISLGKRYIGQDISEIHVHESNKIINFLKKNKFNIDVTVFINDSSKSTGAYPCLFTCPPYGDKEIWEGEDNLPVRSCDEWIDICLDNYKCKRYVFIVDNTIKYKDYIVDILLNKSHIGVNQEFIVKIDC